MNRLRESTLHKESLKRDGGKSLSLMLSLMLKQYADCLSLNTSNNGESGSNMAKKKNSKFSVPLCEAICPTFYLKMQTPVLKDFMYRRALIQ